MIRASSTHHFGRMRSHGILLRLTLSSQVVFASSSQFVSDATCNFTFSLGNLPNLLLPEAGPNSPGDVQLNDGNPIVTVENDTVHSCNGDAAVFHVGDDTWNTSFTGNDGDEYDIDVFYAAQQDELWVRTLQTNMDPSLYEALENATVRLEMTCNGNTTGCIEFTTSFTGMTPYNYSAPFQFNDTCFHGFSTGERVPSIKVPAASPTGPTASSSLGTNYTLVLAGKADEGLPWSEGFRVGGVEKDDDFWGEWWENLHNGFEERDQDDDAAVTVGSGGTSRSLRQVVDTATDCTGSTSEVWDSRVGEWKSTFATIDGESHDLDMFYINVVDGMSELWVTEIESWMAPSLYNQLQYSYVKLSLTCPSSVQQNSCAMFSPRFTNWSPEIEGSMAGYRFSDPAVPSFDLPEAAPNSPGEVLLTSGNAIVTRTGARTETYCNGDRAEYYGEDGHWYAEFLMSDGESHEVKHIFYPESRDLYSATIQANWEPSLRGLLSNRVLRIRVWCTNDERAEYLFFRVNGEESTCDDVEDLCTEVSTSGTAIITPTFSQCATTLSTAYLGWWWLSKSVGEEGAWPIDHGDVLRI